MPVQTSTRARTPALAPPSNAFLALLAQLKPQIDARLLAALTKEQAHHAASGPEVTDSLAAAQQLCAGGKRLRAALVCVGRECFEASGAANKTTVLESGVALEMLQAYFLIHDDWMDQDNTRRGVPAVHVSLAQRFGSEHKGAAAAVLVGDYLVALSTRHLAQAVRRHAAFAPLLECFAQMQLDAVAGQQLDVVGLSRDAERVYRYKTASYTVRGPLQLGALLAGASARSVATLAGFADHLGIAFQLRDDLLGAFGTPEETGKPAGNDLIQGKWTWVVQYALEHGSAAERKALKSAFGNAQASTAQVQAATRALSASGAVAACEARIVALRAQAETALKRLRITPRGRELLSGAISALLERRA